MLRLLFLTLVFSSLFSCKKKSQENDSKYTYELTRLQVEYVNNRAKLINEFIEQYDSFHSEIQLFTSTLQTLSLNSARENWVKTYGKNMFLQPYAYSNFSGSNLILPAKSILDIAGINKEYIDYTLATPNGGMINNPTQYPNFNNILDYHQVGNEKNISVGFHALEFVLWGEDTGTGIARPNSDFASFTTNGDRRSSFISFCSFEMKQEIGTFDNYTEANLDIKSVDAQDFISILFDPLVKHINYTAETGLKKSYDSQDEADQLCPSSNRSADVLLKMIESIDFYLNPYGDNPNLNEYSIAQFMEEIAPEIQSGIETNLEKAKTSIEGIADVFESSISNPAGRQEILIAYNALKEVESSINAFKIIITKD